MAEVTKESVQALLGKWAPVSQERQETVLTMPIHVLLGEALDLATVVEHYWQPQKAQGLEVPGFVSVAGPGRVTKETASEIRELHAAVSAAHSRYLILVEASNQAPLERADFVLSEIRAALTFAFEADESTTAQAQLERLRDAFPDSGSQDLAALALEAYAELGDAHVKELEVLGFDLSLLTEARTLGATLRARSAERLTNSAQSTQREALALRNRLASLLIDRMRLARSAARYAFRHHPDIARKATSAYERKRRARHRSGAETAADDTLLSAESSAKGPVANSATIAPTVEGRTAAALPAAARPGGPFAG